MGLFDFFKKKTSTVEQHQPAQVNKNWYVLEVLEARLIEMGYQVERHQQYLALVVSEELELSWIVIENPDNHPDVIHLMVSASHPQYFPDGIIENVAGVGHSIQEQIISVLDNYINTTFVTIMDGFSDSHNPDIDFTATTEDKEVLWHPKLGALSMQGQWETHPENEPVFELLRNEIPAQLTSNKIQWLKIYLLKTANGEIVVECLFNNQPWDIATNMLYQYVQGWDMPDDFNGLKQFIVFRRCDAYDSLFIV